MRKPFQDLTLEELRQRHQETISRHHDAMAGERAKCDALLKRLESARKAKSLANARADVAEATMRVMLNKLKDVIHAQ